jgi:hypothetical protein
MEANFIHAAGVLALAPTKHIVRYAYTHGAAIGTNLVSMSALAM